MRYKQTEKNRKQCKQLILSISAPNALSGFNAPKNKEGLVAVAIPTPHKHTLSCTTCKNKIMYNVQKQNHVQRAKTNQPIDYKDHENPTTHKCANSSTHQLTNSSTHQLTNSSIKKITSSPTHQLTNSSTQKHINSSTHQLKNLNCYFLFYNNALFFVPF